MIKKPELPHAHHVFAEPTPLGLLGLAIGCAALTPIAFGIGLTPAGLKTAAMFCLLFGGGCQFLAGIMNFANKNLYGGTVLTTFSFNWAMNWWALDAMSEGLVPDHSIIFATEVVSLLIFVVITYGFGYFSKLLFIFLLDIDLLYAAKVINGITGTTVMNVPIAIFTVALGLIALWIAFAMLINPTAGKAVFAIAGPAFFAPKQASFDFSVRESIFRNLYEHWREHAFGAMSFEELQGRMKAVTGDKSIKPELFFLSEMGGVMLSLDPDDDNGVKTVRLTAAGIDEYERNILRKHQVA